MPSLMPYRGSNNLPAPHRREPKPPAQRRPAKPPLAARRPGLLDGLAVTGAALPKLFTGTVYAGLAVAAFVYRAALPGLLIWRFPLAVWAIGGLVVIAAWELVPFGFAIIGFGMRRRAEAWEREQIHQANSYGDARAANWTEAHDALRGRPGLSPGAHQVFDE